MTSILRYYVALAKFWHRLVKLALRMLGVKKTVYVQERVSDYREIWQSAAVEQGFQFLPLSDSIWEIRDGDKRVARINNYVISLDDPVTLDMAGDKLLTYRLFAEADLPIPKHAAATIDTLWKIQRFIDQTAGPYVVKPARNTASGLGVTTNLWSLRQCATAFALAFSYCDEILIEQHIVGESYRLVYLGHEMVCAARRTGLRVSGDGHRTIEQLLMAEHGDWRRDPDVQFTIAAQGLKFAFVPESGHEVLVRSVGRHREGKREVRTVYTEDVSGKLCAAIVEEGRKASIALGSEFCGVDVITADPSVPLRSSNGTIAEINTTPGLHHHYGLESSSSHAPLAQTVLRYSAEKSRLRVGGG